METVGTDRAHHELNIGDGPRPRVEPDLGLAVWRRHINLGLISHTQSSRIWRQASQGGQVPLMRQIAERLGTGTASVSRTWESLPFVMARRMPMVQARTIPAIGSAADRKGQPEVHGLTNAPRSEPNGSPAIALDLKGLDGHATASPIGIQREAQSVTSDQLPLVQHSAAGMHDRHQGGGPEVTSISGSSQRSELSTASPMGIQREAPAVTSDHLTLVQRSAAGTHERYRDGGSKTDGLLSESPISQAMSSVFAPTSDLSMDASPSSPVLRRVNRSNTSSVRPGDATMGEATHGISSGKSPEGLVTEGATQGLASISGQDLTLFRHPLARDAGAPSSLVLQAPILRRALKRDAPTVSDQSGIDAKADGAVSEQVTGPGNFDPDFTLVRPLALVQNHPEGVVSNGGPGVAGGLYQTSIQRMRQAGSLDMQPMSASSGRHEPSPTVPLILRNVRPTIHRASGLEFAYEPAWNRLQRQKDSQVSANGVVSSPSPLLPLIQRAERPLTSSDSPTLIWRSPIPGAATGSPLPDGATDHQPDSGSIRRNLMPFIARQARDPAGLHVPHPGMPSMDELPARAGSRGGSTPVNHAEIAEQVSRLLTRQLAAERERRGVRS